MKIKFIISNQYLGAIGDTHRGEFISARLEKVETLWKKDGPKIMRAIEKVTHLKFQEESIKCYVTTTFNISDPLTINISHPPKEVVDNLTHELIHVILTQNYRKIKKGWGIYWDYLEGENFTVKAHVMVHAIHFKVGEFLGYSKNHQTSIRTWATDPDYRRAWDLAERLGWSRVVKYLSTR